MKTSPPSVAEAHIGYLAILGSQILGNGDIDLLRLFRIIRITVGLRIVCFPMPGKRGVRERKWPMSPPQGEKGLQFGARLLRVADHQRLPLPAKPQLGIAAGLIKILVN